MKPLLFSSVALAFAAAPAAQITVSMTVPTPIDVTCVEGGTTQTATQPSGSSNYFDHFTGTQNTFAGIGASATSDDLSASIGVSLSASVGPAAPSGSSATVGPASVLVFLSCATATPVLWEAPFVNDSFPGVAPPLFEVDLGDDGVVDYINGQLTSLSQPHLLGPQPLAVRLTFSVSPQQPGLVSASQGLVARPWTQVASTPVAIGCTNGGSGIGATATFLDQGVRLGAVSFFPNMPWVAMVIGWDTAPVLLPSHGQTPCLFVPTVDIVVLQGFGIAPLDVPLPAAVRPVTFWIQGVIPDSQLLTTDCLRVDAL